MSLVTDYLTDHGVQFEVLPHQRTFTSMEEARALGVAADEVLKTVALTTRRGHALAVILATRRLDLRLVREALDDPDARLATEGELRVDFPGYELGALPPLGSLLGVPLLLDPEVLRHGEVVFAAGSETESVKTSTGELFRDQQPTVTQLSREDDRGSVEPLG
jgi:Ala-tRNA(Pro) deacylase